MTVVRSEIITDCLNTDGGPGSGNHNHAGIPGHQGGSAPKGGITGTVSGAFEMREELRPKNDTYEDGETFTKWQQVNMRGKDNPNRIALTKVFNEGGMEAVQQEYYNYKLQKNTKDLHKVTMDEAGETIYDNMSQSTYDGWMREANSEYKPRIVNSIVSSPEMRNATLNVMYENFKYFNESSGLSFEEFLNTPVTMYRGGHGQQHTEDDIFSSYTFDEKVAKKFAGENGKVYEAKIKPIDTYGSLSTNGESEIFVPSVLAPNGNVDGDEWMDVSKVLTEDGGPGSGNWGHAGRPGLPGGSAAGGGKAYRLTTPSGGFTGLSGAYKANAAYSKGGKEALMKALGVDPETMQPKGAQPTTNKESSAFDNERYSREHKDKAIWDEEREEIHDRLIGSSGEAWKSMSSDEREALYEYTGSSFDPMNIALYEHEYENGTCPNHVKEYINDTTSALQKASTPEDIWAQRGTSVSSGAKALGVSEDLLQRVADGDAEALRQLEMAVVGKERTQDGFLSSSPKKGEGFSWEDVVLNLYLPKGSHAIYAEPFSACGNGKHKSWDGEYYSPVSGFDEFELLIQRGATIKFTKVEAADGYVYIDGDIYTPDVKELKTAA